MKCFSNEEINEKISSRVIDELSEIISVADEATDMNELLEKNIPSLIRKYISLGYTEDGETIGTDRDTQNNIMNAINVASSDISIALSMMFDDESGIKYDMTNEDKQIVFNSLINTGISSNNVIQEDGIHVIDLFDQNNNSITSFMEKVYGSQEAPYRRMESLFNDNLFNALIINGNGENATPVSPYDIKWNLAAMKLRFMADILSFIDNNTGSNNSSKIDTYNSIADILENNDVTYTLKNKEISKIDNYNEMNDVLNKFKNAFSESEIFKSSKLSSYSVSNDNNDVNALNVYNKVFILNNLDKLIDMKFENVFDISNKNSKMILKDISFGNSTSNIHTTWLDNDDVISAYKEAGSMTKLILGSMSYYNGSVKTSRKLRFNEINDAIGLVKQASWENIDFNIVVNGSIFSMPDGSIPTLRDIIENFNTDSQLYLETITRLIKNGAVVNDGNEMSIPEFIARTVINTDSSGRNEARIKSAINNINSLFSNIYDMGLISSFNKSIDPRYINYFNYVANYIQGAYRNKYIQRYIDDDGNISSISLSDKPYELARMKFKSDVYSSSIAIVNNINRYASELQNKYSDSYQKEPDGKNKQFKIEHNFISNDGNVQFDENGSYVRFVNFPIEKEGVVNLFNITVKFDGTNMDNSVDINVNGIDINSVDKMSMFSDYVNNGEPTSFDKILQSVYQINTINNSELRSYLYKGRTSLYNLFKGAMITSAISYINNEVYSNESKFPNSASIQNDILKRSQTGKYTLIPGNRRGISNLPSFTLNVENMILEATAVNNNMLSRDTVTDSSGNQLAITNMQRSSNSLDEQRSNIRKDSESTASRNVMSMRLNELNDVIGSSFDSNEMIFLGNDIERETSINGESKDRSDFNVSECLTADIFMSYFDDISTNDNSPYTFVTSVNSDKSLVNRSKINRKFIDFLRKAGILGIQNIDDVSYDSIVKMNKLKRYDTISKINRNIYSKLIENIKSDFDRMFSIVFNRFDYSGDVKTPSQAIDEGYFIKADFEKHFTLEEEKMLDTIIGYISLNQIDINSISDMFNNNFSVFNDILDAVNIKDGYKALMTISKYANYRNKISGINENIGLIDQTHVVKNKDANGNTRVYVNNAIMLEYATYNNVNEDILNKFNLSYVDKPGFIKVENIRDILERSAIDSVLYAIIDNDFEVKLSNESGDYIKTKGFMNVIPNMVKNGWADSHNVFLLKLKSKNGIITNVRSIDDLIRVKLVDSEGKLNIDMLDEFNIEVNPLLEEYSTIHSFVSEQTINFEVGGRYNHPIKGVATTASQLRSALQLAQTKRNVSITASYHPLTMNCLDGLAEDIEIACISDIEENKSSYIGNNKKISPHDGATFFSPLTYYWWNGSMADTVSKGFNMKPFIHFYNPRTMTAGIIKTAGFPITNNFLRQGPNVMNMARRFMANEWRDANGNPITGNIFKDYTFRLFRTNGESRDLSTYMIDKYDGKLFVRKSQNEYLRITGITYKGDNIYEINYERVDIKGNKIGDYKPEEVSITSNFDLWKAFGAEQSMQLNEDGVLEYGETSFKIVADIANNVGMGVNGEKITSDNIQNYRTQKSVYQFMKHGNAHMIVTNGAIKQGMENMNDYKDVYFGKRGMPNLFSIRMTTGGIQLDKSHSAEGHEISELTQVMSSLSSMGFTKDKASDVYNAISNIVESSFNNIIEKHIDDTGNVNYNDVAAELILRAMSESGAFEDDVRDACSSLIMQYEKGFNVTYEQLSDAIHINDSVFSNKAIPIVMSLINKISIKKSYAGGLNVINPSYGLVQMFGGYLWNGLGVNDDEKISSLLNMQSESDRKNVDIHDIMPQRIYYIKTENGTVKDANGKTISFVMNSYEDYELLKREYKNSIQNGDLPTIHELFIRESYSDEESDIKSSGNLKYKVFGRELSQDSYHITGIYTDIDNNGNSVIKKERFNLFDLDSTRFMFDAKNMKRDIYDYLIDVNTHDRIIRAIKYMAQYKYPNDMNMAMMFENKITSMLYKNINGVYTTNDIYSNSELLSNFIKFARIYHQITVENISNAMNNRSAGNVIVDNNIVKINDSESVEYHAHEAIAPCIFREQFGIPKDTRIKDITPEFFARKMVSQMNVGLNSDYYHFALLHNSMRNTLFIYDSSRFSTKKYTDVFSDAELVDGDYNFLKDEGSDYKWLLDSKGNKLYMIGDDDIVYKKDGKYVVVTGNPSRILKKHSYASIDISPSIYDNINKREWNSIDIGKRIEDINNDVKAIFNSAKYKYDNDGTVIDGSGSTTHMVYINEDGSSVIDSVLDITKEKALAKYYNTDTPDYELYVQRKLLDKINKGMLFSMESSVSSYENMIYRNAISMYKSFRKTLEILAARTPSQTMQSFMSMEIAEFDNSGLNQCFVSTSQIWFQGSDFDIDAVNFQSHKVDRRGQYIGWSPLFDNLHLEESLKLPFPTGEKYYIAKVSDENASGLFYKIFNIKADENGIRTYVKSKDASISDMAEYIKECNNNKAIYVPIIEGAQDSAYEAVSTLVNSHNLYYNDNDVTNDGLKNNITENSIAISKDPINMIESESSVDDQTDVKDAGAKNTDAVRQLNNLTWNMTNTYSLGVNAQVGKDVVSITAAGLKNFYLITHYYNTLNVSGMFKEVMSDSTTNEEKASILGNIIRALSLGNGKGVRVGNKYYLTSSNFNPDDETKNMLNYIYNNYKDLIESLDGGRILFNALENLVNACNYGIMDNDNALVLSALLSEATDNMKNLNLSKINATKDMAPLYIFGLTIGMTINDISNFMQSGTVKVIDKIKHGNIFYGNASKMSISDIYNRTISRKGRLSISSGMSKSNNEMLNNVHISSLGSIAEKLKFNGDNAGSEYIYDLIKRINEFSINSGNGRFDDAMMITPVNIASNLSLYKTDYTNKNYKDGTFSVFNDYDLVIEILDTFRKYSGMLNISGNQYTIERENNLFINWIGKLIRAVNNRRIIENDGNKINAVIALDEGNKEMLKISLFASLNKGVKTTQTKLISYNTRMNDIFSFDSSKYEDEYPSLKSESNPFVNRKKNTLYGFSLDKFISSRRYAEDAINFYGNNTQHAFNVLNIAKTMPHISSYIKTADRANKVVNGMSPKKNIINKIVDAYMIELGYPLKEKDREALIRETNKFVNSLIFNNWVNSRPIKFHIPVGCKYYKDTFGNAGRLKITTNDTGEPIEMYLGTNAGNASFIEWMNSIVIPNMKDGFNSDNKSSEYKVRSKFINDMNTFTSNKVYNDEDAPVYALPVNSRSNDEVDVIRKTEYKVSSINLGVIKYISNSSSDGNSDNDIEYSAANLLYLYNQILYSGVMTNFSIDEYMGASTLKNEYLSYESSITSNEDRFMDVVGSFIMNDYIMMQIAPIGDGRTTSLKYSKYFDRELMRNVLIKVSEKKNDKNENQQNIQEDENIDDEGFIENDNPINRRGFDKSKYELVNGDSMRGMNSPKMIDEDVLSISKIEIKTDGIGERKYTTSYTTKSGNEMIISDLNSKVIILNQNNQSQFIEFDINDETGIIIQNVMKIGDRRRMSVLIDNIINNSINCN